MRRENDVIATDSPATAALVVAMLLALLREVRAHEDSIPSRRNSTYTDLLMNW